MEDYIRPPDKPIRECLLPSASTDTNALSDEDTYLQRILEESATDYELQFALEESKRMEEEREERAMRFVNFRCKIKQFERIDKSNAAFYEELIYHIDMYETHNISPVIVSNEFYELFRKTVHNMRLKPEEKDALFEFILFTDKR